MYLPPHPMVHTVHSCPGNPRQGESENVDGNTRLALDPLVQPRRSCLALLSTFLAVCDARVKGLVSRLAVASCPAPKLRALGKSVESHSPNLVPGNSGPDSRQMHLARVYSRHYS